MTMHLMLPGARDLRHAGPEWTFMHSGPFRIEATSDSLGEAIFCDLALGNRAGATLHERWSVAPGPLPALPGTVLMRQRTADGMEAVLLGVDRGVVHLVSQNELVRVMVAAADDERANAIIAELRAAIPVRQRDAAAVRVTFWSLGRLGPATMVRDLEAPAWTEIIPNYAAPTAAALHPLLAPDWRPAGARLLLWHGEPGTGKTYAARALMRAWQPWCDTHVVVDPEKFFGTADYMFQVLLGDGGPGSEGDDGAGPSTSRWQLLVLEDTGELLSADAHERSGQGLSRLLNLCDGLVGQGLKTLVLITTNEDQERLHRAVTRPGRCLGAVEFVPFDATGAAQWCAARGVAGPSGPATLADLYARIDGRVVPERPRAAGFAAA